MGMQINRVNFREGFQNTDGKVPYTWDGKPDWGSDSSTWRSAGSDCSGYGRWLLSISVVGLPTDYPEGSVGQHEWAIANLSPVSVDYVKADCSNNIYQFFLTPQDSSDGVGHTGFFQNCGCDDGGDACSVECYGGHGVGSRPLQALLDRNIKYFYLWPSFVP